jgi:16S rRNA (guanine527-N7)-methyltransferase
MDYKSYPESIEFQKQLEEIGIELSEYQYQQFFDYYNMLVERNKVMNLTAITDLSEVICKHFVDSLSIVKFYPIKNQKILDLGTGAGFPGIPLKIAFPEIDIVLLDSLNKRLKFLDEVIYELKLDKIITLHGRAEDFGRDISYREQFDLCVSRAVAKLSSLSEYCLPYVKIGGSFISYKSGKIEEEIKDAAKAIEVLGAEVYDTTTFLLPGTDIERSIIHIRKVAHTPKAYPRSAGKPTKQPI